MTTMTGSSSGTGHDGAVSDKDIADFRTSFEADPSARIAQNAVTSTDINDVALNRSIVTETDFSFSTLLDDWEVTNQKQSGRCWMFAALNLMRVGAMKTMNLKNFEFSQNYMFFWDKFERANYFLEQIIDTADRDLDDRTVAFMLGGPIDDGGQWNMFMNLVRRHGVVPQSVMPETQSSSSSGRMNASLKHKLREGARTLRGMVAEGRSAGKSCPRSRPCSARSGGFSACISGHPPPTSTGSGTTRTRCSTATDA